MLMAQDYAVKSSDGVVQTTSGGDTSFKKAPVTPTAAPGALAVANKQDETRKGINALIAKKAKSATSSKKVAR